MTAITSAFGDPTRREIYLFAHAADAGVTATEVAERFALHPNVARHHLDKLVAGGYVDIATARAAGAGGGGGGASLGTRREMPMCPELARTLLHGHRYDGSRATRDLGLAYTPINDTIRRTVAWYRAEGLLPDTSGR